MDAHLCKCKHKHTRTWSLHFPINPLTPIKYCMMPCTEDARSESASCPLGIKTPAKVARQEELHWEDKVSFKAPWGD